MSGAMSEGEQVERLVAKLRIGPMLPDIGKAADMLESLYAENALAKKALATLIAERDAALLRVQRLEAYALSVYVHESGCAMNDDKDCDCIISTFADQTFRGDQL